jgi:hypothetical protein
MLSVFLRCGFYLYFALLYPSYKETPGCMEGSDSPVMLGLHRLAQLAIAAGNPIPTTSNMMAAEMVKHRVSVSLARHS